MRKKLKKELLQYQADDDDEAGDGGEDEHDGGRLDVILAEHLHFGRADHFHVNALSSCKEQLMKCETPVYIVIYR